MTKKQILFFRNLLANCHDWDVEDLENEILLVMNIQFSQINKREVLKVYRAFEQLSPTVKFNPLFDIEKFIAETLNS